jgi:aspartyl/asparaginyl beta-hydroxylase (cupin superfamily)
MKPKDAIFFLVYGVFAWFLPWLALFYLICGLVDFRRSHRLEWANWRRYFMGNGILTWVLSPFNLFVDLLCLRNKGVYQLTDLPDECQAEIRQLMTTADNKPELITELSKRMEERKRGMMFFKWYGRNIDNSLEIPEFHQQFKYIKTIGVSIFNRKQKTSRHYGPLRVTLRVLYNLVPLKNDSVYIEAGNQRHLWHDNPLFIFDDTLVHQSVNGSDQLRYCMFVDILRPARSLAVLDTLLSGLKTLIISFNRVFYKNWDMIK